MMKIKNKKIIKDMIKVVPDVNRWGVYDYDGDCIGYIEKDLVSDVIYFHTEDEDFCGKTLKEIAETIQEIQEIQELNMGDL